MTVAKQIDIRTNIKTFFDMAADGEVVFCPRKENKNVYVISQAEYEELQKAKRNVEYLTMIDNSIEQIKTGKVITKSLEELEALASE